MSIEYESAVRDIRITAASRKDIDSVLTIEADSFDSPWSRMSFEEELIKQDSLFITAKTDTRIIGYAVAWLIVNEIHIANLAVHKEWRRKGVACSLVEAFFSMVKNCDWAWLEVRKSNISALMLYKKMGFIEMGFRKKYYEKEGEDAIVMAKSLRENI